MLHWPAVLDNPRPGGRLAAGRPTGTGHCGGRVDVPQQRRVTVVQTDQVAATTAPYSHALSIEGGRLLLISGQGPVDREGNVVGVGDPQAQVRQVFANIQALVEAA